MEISTAILLAIVLLIGLWVPDDIWYIRRGKARGHTWFTWWKPRVTPTLARTLVGSDRPDLARTMRGRLVSDRLGGSRLRWHLMAASRSVLPRVHAGAAEYFASTWMSFT